MQKFLLVLGIIAMTNTARAAGYDVFEKNISTLQSDMSSGRTNSEAIVSAYLARIDAIDRGGPALRSVIAIHPDALAEARALDEERRYKGPRGPLHGIPILAKDNIESRDNLPTTAGSLALSDNVTHRDAPVVARLRAAGGGSASFYPATSGYPHLTVPTGYVSGLPVGMSFIGPAWSEAKLLQFGAAFEKIAPPRKPPRFLPSLEETPDAATAFAPFAN